MFKSHETLPENPIFEGEVKYPKEIFFFWLFDPSRKFSNFLFYFYLQKFTFVENSVFSSSIKSWDDMKKVFVYRAGEGGGILFIKDRKLEKTFLWGGVSAKIGKNMKKAIFILIKKSNLY